LEAELKDAGVRVVVDARRERVNLKIRQAQLDKIPHMLVVGDREVADWTVSVRLRNGEQLAPQSFGEFKEAIRMATVGKTKDLKFA
jgi:threonyl-tRNA synthetase